MNNRLSALALETCTSSCLGTNVAEMDSIYVGIYYSIDVNSTCRREMVILFSTTFCIWQYYASFVFCAVVVDICCFNEAPAICNSNGVLDPHFFWNQIVTIAKAVIVASRGPSMLAMILKNDSGGINIFSFVSFGARLFLTSSV